MANLLEKSKPEPTPAPQPIKVTVDIKKSPLSSILQNNFGANVANHDSEMK
jgi:hypothetical protein